MGKVTKNSKQAPKTKHVQAKNKITKSRTRQEDKDEEDHDCNSVYNMVTFGEVNMNSAAALKLYAEKLAKEAEEKAEAAKKALAEAMASDSDSSYDGESSSTSACDDDSDGESQEKTNERTAVVKEEESGNDIDSYLSSDSDDPTGHEKEEAINEIQVVANEEETIDESNLPLGIDDSDYEKEETYQTPSLTSNTMVDGIEDMCDKENTAQTSDDDYSGTKQQRSKRRRTNGDDSLNIAIYESPISATVLSRPCEDEATSHHTTKLKEHSQEHRPYPRPNTVGQQKNNNNIVLGQINNEGATGEEKSAALLSSSQLLCTPTRPTNLDFQLRIAMGSVKSPGSRDMFSSSEQVAAKNDPPPAVNEMPDEEEEEEKEEEDEIMIPKYQIFTSILFLFGIIIYIAMNAIGPISFFRTIVIGISEFLQNSRGTRLGSDEFELLQGQVSMHEKAFQQHDVIISQSQEVIQRQKEMIVVMSRKTIELEAKLEQSEKRISVLDAIVEVMTDDFNSLKIQVSTLHEEKRDSDI